MFPERAVGEVQIDPSPLTARETENRPQTDIDFSSIRFKRQSTSVQGHPRKTNRGGDS